MAQNHSNTTHAEAFIQYCIVLCIGGLLFLLYYYGIWLFPNLMFKPVYETISKALFPQNRELIFKFILLIFVYAYHLTRDYKKQKDMNVLTKILLPVASGGILFFGILPILMSGGIKGVTFSTLYLLSTLSGFFLLLYGLSNVRKISLNGKMLSQFDREGKTFPMQQKLIETDYSVNIQGEKSVINIVNHFAGVTILGVPGTGKTFVWVAESIIQLIQKGFTACIYDFKEGELSTLAWNVFCIHQKEIQKKCPGIQFSVFDPNNPRKSVRLNPISPTVLISYEHCIDAATTFYYNLIPGASDKRGDIFFPESGRAYICSLFLFLRFSTLRTKKNAEGKVVEGNCCTIAHVIALASYMNEYTGKGQDEFYQILMHKAETKAMFKTAFADAIESKAGNQLAGQLASGKLPLSFLNSPNLFWALTGDDVTLDINNPERPQILCLKNAGEVLAEMYSPVLGLILGQTIKTVNTNDRLPCLISVDEAYTVYLRDVDKLIATGRSRKISTWLIMQDFEMLSARYKKEQADIIKNICATKIAGRVNGGTAEYFEKVFGKSLHSRISTTTSKQDITQTDSQSLEFIMPQADIIDLQNREFIGIVADDAGTKKPLDYRKFRDVPTIDVEKRKKYSQYTLPDYVTDCNDDEMKVYVELNYKSVYADIQALIAQEHNKINSVI